MAITYKDIGDLSQKSAVAGTEKLPVSDTEYITPSQITGDYLPLSGGTMTGSIYLSNSTYIQSKNSGGTNQNVLGMNNSNQLLIGYGSGGSGYDTRLYGNNIQLRYGTGRTEGLTVSYSGDTTVTGPSGKQQPLKVIRNQSGAQYTAIGFASSDTEFGCIGMSGVGQAFVRNGSATTYYKLYSAKNITISSSTPSSSDGEDGDIWIVI